MSLSENELIYLMAYVDGQVDDDELPEVTALLARSEEARAIVGQHQAMGDWLRHASDAHAKGAGADRIAPEVVRQIDELGGGKVIGIERERARQAKNRQRVKEFGALFVVAAAAAAFFLFPTSTSTPGGPVAVAPTPAPEVAPAPARAAQELQAASPAPSASGAVAATEADEDPSVDVQSVESPSHPFSIFYVPGATGMNAHASSVVVWVQE